MRLVKNINKFILRALAYPLANLCQPSFLKRISSYDLEESRRFESTVGKEVSADKQHFLLFSAMFSST